MRARNNVREVPPSGILFLFGARGKNADITGAVEDGIRFHATPGWTGPIKESILVAVRSTGRPERDEYPTLSCESYRDRGL
jgi:hypothetical protein